MVMKTTYQGIFKMNTPRSFSPIMKDLKIIVSFTIDQKSPYHAQVKDIKYVIFTQISSLPVDKIK